jgi:hypothetical protein
MYCFSVHDVPDGVVYVRKGCGVVVSARRDRHWILELLYRLSYKSVRHICIFGGFAYRRLHRLIFEPQSHLTF